MLPTVQTSEQIGGVHTEVLIQNYGDRTLVLVTQLGKVGNLVRFGLSFSDQCI